MPTFLASSSSGPPAARPRGLRSADESLKGSGVVALRGGLAAAAAAPVPFTRTAELESVSLADLGRTEAGRAAAAAAQRGTK